MKHVNIFVALFLKPFIVSKLALILNTQFSWAIIWTATYRKVPKFLDMRKHCCKKPKIQEKGPIIKKMQME